MHITFFSNIKFIEINVIFSSFGDFAKLYPPLQINVIVKMVWVLLSSTVTSEIWVLKAHDQ